MTDMGEKVSASFQIQADEDPAVAEAGMSSQTSDSASSQPRRMTSRLSVNLRTFDWYDTHEQVGNTWARCLQVLLPPTLASWLVQVGILSLPGLVCLNAACDERGLDARWHTVYKVIWVFFGGLGTSIIIYGSVPTLPKWVVCVAPVAGITVYLVLFSETHVYHEWDHICGDVAAFSFALAGCIFAKPSRVLSETAQLSPKLRFTNLVSEQICDTEIVQSMFVQVGLAALCVCLWPAQYMLLSTFTVAMRTYGPYGHSRAESSDWEVFAWSCAFSVINLSWGAGALIVAKQIDRGKVSSTSMYFAMLLMRHNFHFTFYRALFAEMASAHTVAGWRQFFMVLGAQCALLWIMYAVRCSEMAFKVYEVLIRELPSTAFVLDKICPPGETHREWLCFMVVDFALGKVVALFVSIQFVTLTLFSCQFDSTSVRPMMSVQTSQRFIFMTLISFAVELINIVVMNHILLKPRRVSLSWVQYIINPWFQLFMATSTVCLAINQIDAFMPHNLI